MIPRSSIRRALVISVALHAVAAAIAWRAVPSTRGAQTTLVDIELAPPPPMPEALPPELARPLDQPPAAPATEDQAPASAAPDPENEAQARIALDAGVDARADAPIDARPDARPDAAIDARPDAAIDAPQDAGPDAGTDAGTDTTLDAALDDAAMTVASTDNPRGGDAGEALQAAAADAGGDAIQIAAAAADPHASTDAGNEVARVATAPTGDAGSQAARVATAPAGTEAPPIASTVTDAGAGGDAAQLASSAGPAPGGTGSGGDLGAPLDTAALAAALGADPGPPGTAGAPAVDGAPTTAGTAANLLTYLPAGHIVTALIRFDRLRGTEWAAQAERLLRPMPDYQGLFGARDAAITDKLDTLVISTPRPRDAAATTLVARTSLARRALRDFLGATAPVTWSATRGGLLGKRGGTLPPTDHRVFLSPFKGWFLLAQPDDLGALTGAAKGNLDAVEATAALPAWLAGIRTIERETGEARGPALVVTLGLPGKRLKLGGNDLGLGLGLRSVPTPERASLAMELVPQGWLVRGNLRFASDADAAELIASVQQLQHRVAGSYPIQLLIGKPVAHVLASLAFARNGPRVSYATSVSIADARALLTFLALQLDQYFGRAP